ncbi:uncharacterized protein LOC120204346 [Hibiscus syriacus]|uniref:uncharacterized protein LOC120204346 n=1 Tax=Hibiscus syriacus TaxID=106335 RepID=UPI00192112EE|nr:uncharacterized protein LOC120204346 [Hibiscus syriacus]
METRVKEDKSEAILNSQFLNWNACTNYDLATNGRIWVLWRKGIDFTIIQISDQCITIKGSSLGSPVFISAIYGSNDGSARMRLWQTIREVDHIVNQSPWTLGVDFNIFLHSEESSDHELLGNYVTPDMKDFQDLSQDIDIMDHPYFGPTFTWSNKQQEFFLARKLDRVMINSTWASYFPHSFVEFLSPSIFDHCMATMWLSKDSPINRPKPFKFFNFWAAHSNFLNVVRHSWLPTIHGNPMTTLITKLKRLKITLKSFNKDNFSNISDRVKLKRLELEQQQILTLKGEESIVKEIGLQEDLILLEEAEAEFLKQKAKVQCIRDGDKNSKFFHSIVASKNKRNIIRVLVDDSGCILESFDSMSQEVLSFYSNMLGSADASLKEVDPNLLKELIDYSLPSEASTNFIRDITDEEIHNAIFCQGNDKAPGPDGFTPLFFKKTWPIFGRDIIAAVRYFFSHIFINPAFNSTIIALVPKIPNPSTVKDFRPISRCSVIYKAISKILVSRLNFYIPDIVSLNQSTFIRGKSIMDNTFLTQ